VRVLDEILTHTHGSAFHTHPVPERWAGRTVAEVHTELYTQHRALLVSVERDGELLVNPLPTLTLAEGQRIVVLAGADFRPLT
jgi:Trk K+ transport system NAD-binding subunit